MIVHHERIEPPPLTSFRLLRWSEGLNLVESVLPNGSTVPLQGVGDKWHAHGAMELTYIQHGNGTRFVGDHIGAIRSPELVLVGANLPHYWSGLRPSAGTSIQLDLEARDIRSTFPELLQLRPLLQAAERGLLFSKPIASTIGQLMSQLADANGLSRLRILFEIFEQLLEEFEQNATTLCHKPFALTSGDRHSEAISQAIGLISKHFCEDLTLEDLCQAVNLTRATFCRNFKRHTGHSPIDFLNSVRLDHACRLLLETKKTISDIAGRSGYNNLSHFNRLFLRQFGCTPSDFRQNSAENNP